MPERPSRFAPLDRCAWCGYNVASLGFPRICPECGHDTRTRPPARRARGIARLVVGLVLIAAGIGAAATAVVLAARNASAAAVAPPVIVSLAALATAIATLATRRPG